MSDEIWWAIVGAPAEKLSCTDKLLLVILLKNSNQDGITQLSGNSIARFASVTVRAVRKRVRELKAKGWIEVTRGGAPLANTYRVKIP
jgi:DNA-binding Lrp family transcriptional regulator